MKKASAEEVMQRAQSDFVEMPGLNLTEAQARRLWALDQATCSTVLQRLVETRFLTRARDGGFRRTDVSGGRD